MLPMYSNLKDDTWAQTVSPSPQPKWLIDQTYMVDVGASELFWWAQVRLVPKRHDLHPASQVLHVCPCEVSLGADLRAENAPKRLDDEIPTDPRKKLADPTC